MKATKHTDGNISSAFYDHTKYMVVDASGHVSLQEVQGNTVTETLYTDEYPYIDPIENTGTPYYSRTITEQAFDAVRITDEEGNEIITENDMLQRTTRCTDPDMGTRTYVYDDNGSLISQTDAKEQVINLEYDRLGRLIYKKYGEDINGTYLYDGLDEGAARTEKTTGHARENSPKLYTLPVMKAMYMMRRGELYKSQNP